MSWILAASAESEASLTLSIAIACGMFAQATARKLQLPALLLLLAGGVLLGPSGIGIVKPSSLGTALPALVGFAVAVILFEGGLNLNIGRVRRERLAIQLLITLGAVVTMVGGAIAARFIMGWEWSISFLFGALVIVTGPTVIGPLLRRLKVKKSVATVLEAEGVLIDAVGAITAAIVLDIVRQEFGAASGGLHILGHLAGGSAIGAVGGVAMALFFRRRDFVPAGLENVFTLSLVFALFHGANALMPESGIAAVTVAGVVMGNVKTHVQRELVEFKEQLTVMFIGMLFILLAADVGLEDVQALGWPGFWTVVVLMLVVRPLSVAASTVGSSLKLAERAFIAWIGPRGIVAAAVASLFASELQNHTDPSLQAAALPLRALVFLVIAMTVASSGLTGGFMARILSLKRPRDAGWVFLGANELARALARLLRSTGTEVVLIDTNHEAANLAEREELRVILGNGLEERSLARSEVDTRAGVIGLSPNAEVNLLFAQRAHHEGNTGRSLVSLGAGGTSVTMDMVHNEGAEVLFGREHDVELWTVRLRHGTADLEEWILEDEPDDGDPLGPRLGPARGPVLALAFQKDEVWQPLTTESVVKAGNCVAFLVQSTKSDEANQLLRELGWSPVVAPSQELPELTAD
ncbi:MAG: cation:proton antiporter [Planctomycetota bacterium]